jgi:hypothetical protein
VKPVVHPPRRVPLNLQPRLKKHLDNLVEQGIIVKRGLGKQLVNCGEA